MLETRLLEPFLQTKYMNEPNYRIYTSIIHTLYIQDRDFFSQPLPSTALLEFLQKDDPFGIFTNYTISKLEEDLKRLEEWHNIESIPDYGKQTRIEDFNKRKFRYTLTQTTIELERKLEEIHSNVNQVKSKLDKGIVKALSILSSQLDKIDTSQILLPEQRSELSALWNQLFEHFKSLRTESSDYLRTIHGMNIDATMKSKELATFREKFTEYLTEFIVTLQKFVNIIEYHIKNIDRSSINWIIDNLVTEQLNKPILDDVVSKDEYYRIYQNQWLAIKRWFIYDDFSERYVDYLLKQTNETISRFTIHLQRISERDKQVRSRQKDFQNIAHLFKRTENLEECQAIFGAISNVEKPMHFYSSFERKIESNKNIAEYLPETKELKEARAIGARKNYKTVALEMSAEDELEQERFNRQKAEEEAVLLKLIAQRELHLEHLIEIKPFVRSAILGWLSEAQTKEVVDELLNGKTEHGISYTIIKKSENLINLSCEDGYLTLPDYVLHFDYNEH